VGVIVDTTPFHPVDAAWPDQPADRGKLSNVTLVDCLTGVVSPSGEVFVGADIPVKRGEPGWDLVVVHVLPKATTEAQEETTRAHVEEHAPVPLVVDDEYRTELSRGHTACHVAALALNTVCADRWTKLVERTDSLGNPDLDQIALQQSLIHPDGAVDSYRLGRSIRKLGLPTVDLLVELPAVQDGVNALLRDWIAGGGTVDIETEGDTLDAMRRWTAVLPGGKASIPCGGTHVTDLADLGAVAVTLAPTDDGFAMTTTVTPHPEA
jgi:alanyl-tRNA synthetase